MKKYIAVLTILGSLSVFAGQKYDSIVNSFLDQLEVTYDVSCERKISPTHECEVPDGLLFFARCRGALDTVCRSNSNPTKGIKVTVTTSGKDGKAKLKKIKLNEFNDFNMEENL